MPRSTVDDDGQEWEEITAGEELAILLWVVACLISWVLLALLVAKRIGLI